MDLDRPRFARIPDPPTQPSIPPIDQFDPIVTSFDKESRAFQVEHPTTGKTIIRLVLEPTVGFVGDEFGIILSKTNNNVSQFIPLGYTRVSELKRRIAKLDESDGFTFSESDDRSDAMQEMSNAIPLPDVEMRQGEGFGYSLPDSGSRREFGTGSVRDTSVGKGRFDLIPSHPMKRLAQHFENGARKYGDNNWRKGQTLHTYLDSALRHVYAYQDGDRSEDHLIAAAWNLFAYVHTEREIREGRLPRELDKLNITDTPMVEYSASK